MKILYILAVLMFIGIFLIFVCSLKVLKEMDQSKTRRTYRDLRPRGQKKTNQPQVKPSMQPCIIGTYLGMTFFAVGSIGSVVAVVRVFTRRF